MVAVSIIIPAYNSSEYISKTISSIKNQTFKDIEVIVVNDGSSDNTKEVVLDSLSTASFPWVIIDQKNQGASMARNRGLGLAKGEYVYFLDSDDYIHPTFIEKMYSTAKKGNYDIVISGVSWVSSDGAVLSRFKNDNCSSSSGALGKEILKLVLRRDIVIAVDNVLYKRGLLIANKIKFNRNRKQFHGDVLEFSYKAFYRAVRVGCVPEVLVFCNTRPNSASRSLSGEILSSHFNSLVRAYYNVKKYINYKNSCEDEICPLLDRYVGFRLLKILFALYSLGEHHNAERFMETTKPLIQKALTRGTSETLLKYLVLYSPFLCRPIYLLHSLVKNVWR